MYKPYEIRDRILAAGEGWEFHAATGTYCLPLEYPSQDGLTAFAENVRRVMQLPVEEGGFAIHKLTHELYTGDGDGDTAYADDTPEYTEELIEAAVTFMAFFATLSNFNQLLDENDEDFEKEAALRTFFLSRKNDVLMLHVIPGIYEAITACGGDIEQ